jgi:hypothetical protein
MAFTTTLHFLLQLRELGTGCLKSMVRLVLESHVTVTILVTADYGVQQSPILRVAFSVNSYHF